MSKQQEILRSVLLDQKDDPEFLIEIILQQAARIAEYETQVETLSSTAQRVSSLQERVLSLERSQHRQVAPFRKDKEQKKDERTRKRPGNKKGHPPYYRQPSGSINEEIEVPLPDTCPQCDSTEVEVTKKVEQIVEELSDLLPRIVRLRTEEGMCMNCGYIFRSTHPLQVSHATGSAKVHLGPKANSLALELEHGYGISKRQCCKMMTDIFQLPLSIGGLVNLNHRNAKALQPNYDKLVEQVQQAKVLHTDETGWYVGATGHYLWVFATEKLSLYKIVGSRNKQELHNVIGDEFEGILVTDCLNLYDNAAVVQQKCYAHHLKAIKNIIQIHSLDGQGYLLQVKELLQQAIELKAQKGTLGPKRYLEKCQQLETKADQLFTGQQRGDPLEQKINFRIFKQRKHLFTFLYHDEVDATNNLAERQLRPAVIARKISCGNKTNKGATSWQVIHSLVVTHYQNDSSFEESVVKAIKLKFEQR